MVNDALFGENVKLSYSRLMLLKCPIKYYMIKFVGIQTFSIHALLGITVHKLYEDILTKQLTIQQAKKIETILGYLEQIISVYQTPPNIKIDLLELAGEVHKHIWSDLPLFIDKKVENGWKLHVEKEHVTQKTIEIFNDSLDVYIRPDIYLLSSDNKQIMLFDIKTAKRYRPSFKDQLTFYLYILQNEYPQINKFSGLVYMSRYGNIKQVTVYDKETLSIQVSKLIEPIKVLYNKFQIKSIKDITKFIKRISTYDSKKLFDIRCKLYSSVGNVCSFCPIKNVCPIANLKQSSDFTKLVTGETKKDIIIITSSFITTNNELIGFVEQ